MAGIYIHVPFCKTRCAYCDFFTQTDITDKTLYIKAIAKETELRSGYLANEAIDTIYFGGGTPSQLSGDDLRFILTAISGNFTVNEKAEITLEANPGDLDTSYLQSLRELGFNRLSIGIQSFDDNQLLFLNRRHSARKAIDAVESAQQAGFDNISIDLMYGLASSTLPVWNDTLDKAIGLNVQHISSYHLIYEEGTPLYRRWKQGKINPVDEELSLEMFSTMIDKLTAAGFIHYEISNFGKENCFSRHNTSYWLGVKYLGLGPAAHSFDIKSRSFNVASISRYVESINAGKLCTEVEILDTKSQYNDFVITGMRTAWGVDSSELEKRFGTAFLQYFRKNIEKHILSGNAVKDNIRYRLNRKGIFISDTIMSDLMYIE